MKARFPLYAKILLWLFLNIALLAGVVAIFFSLQFRGGPEVLLAGPAGDRIRTTAQLISDEFNTQPASEWGHIAQRFSELYGVNFLFYRHDGTQLAGQVTALPEEVSRKVFMAPLRREGRPPREPGGEPPTGRERPASAAPPRVRDTLVVRTENPRRYWIGVRTGVFERGPVPNPATIVLVSDSLRVGGLAMDFKPLLWVLVGAVVFTVLFWLPLIRGITRALGQMNRATTELAEGRFDVRVSERRRDELGSLGAAINRMAGRLAGFVTGQKRFLGDIAHELCTPIARMQMAVGILEERADAKDRQYVEDLREEVQHMSHLVNELLSFSKASLGAGSVKLQTTSLHGIVEKAVRREARDAVVHNQVPGELNATVDPELIVRAVSNLLRNAVRYAGDAGPITISASALENEVELIIRDSGPGVPEQELPKLFDPFYRVDTSRARETGGVGLGLSIVKTCVETCHGNVICRNAQGGGFEAVLRLPA